jgi:hypothetical protein
MKKIYTLVLLLIIAASCEKEDVKPVSLEQQPIVLKNDSYEKNKNSRIYIRDFVEGEEVGASLGPVNYPFTITHAEFFFGTTGEPRTRDIILKVYNEDLREYPGPAIFSRRYTITATNEEKMILIDLSADQLYMPDGGSIRLAIEITDNGLPAIGLPSIAHEWEGTITPERNWIKSGGEWITAETRGFDKDFIIRAVIKEGVPSGVNN